MDSYKEQTVAVFGKVVQEIEHTYSDHKMHVL